MKTEKEKLMIIKIRKNIEKMNQTNLNLLKKQESRILRREKEIEYLDKLYKPAPIVIMSNKIIKSSLNNQFYRTKDTFYKTIDSKFNLPRLNKKSNNNTEENAFNRMKKYKVVLKKKKDILPEEKIKRFLYQSGFSYIPKRNNFEEEKKLNIKNIENNNEVNNNQDNKNDINKENNNLGHKNNPKNKNNIKLNIKIDSNNFGEDKINSNRTKNLEDRKELNKKIKNKNMDFEYYLKMQRKAEIILKPKIGDESTDLVNYINAIQGIRENLIIDILSEINRAENRYNQEKPEVDSNFLVKDKGLNVHKWKNIFFLRDYQKYFLDGLKGKISAGNYRQMLRKFIQIQNVCFSEGKTHFQVIKNINFSE